MTIDQVRQRVEDIRAMSDDDERAHVMEDALREDVLIAIAGDPSVDNGVKSLVVIALSTNNIDFARWCA